MGGAGGQQAGRQAGQGGEDRVEGTPTPSPNQHRPRRSPFPPPYPRPPFPLPLAPPPAYPGPAPPPCLPRSSRSLQLCARSCSSTHAHLRGGGGTALSRRMRVHVCGCCTLSRFGGPQNSSATRAVPLHAGLPRRAGPLCADVGQAQAQGSAAPRSKKDNHGRKNSVRPAPQPPHPPPTHTHTQAHSPPAPPPHTHTHASTRPMHLKQYQSLSDKF